MNAIKNWLQRRRELAVAAASAKEAEEKKAHEELKESLERAKADLAKLGFKFPERWSWRHDNSRGSCIMVGPDGKPYSLHVHRAGGYFVTEPAQWTSAT